MILSHLIALDPTVEQSTALSRACGCARFAWNWLRAKVQECWDRDKKFPNVLTLKKEFNAIKGVEFPWIYDSPKDANQQPFSNQQEAWTRYFQGRKQGKRVGRPRFKKRGQRDSFYVSNDQFRVEGKIVKLPVIGQVRLREELRFQGKITSATVSRVAAGWFISISVEVGDVVLPRHSNGVIGIDLGLKTTITCSDAQTFESPKPLTRRLKRLIRHSKQHSRKQKGSNNRRKSQKRLAREHARIANIRKDWTHKTTTSLARENQTICIEDLGLKGMTKLRSLARGLNDVCLGEIRRQLTYKLIRYGGKLIVIGRFEPSSKTCSECGAVKETLSLAERTYHCAFCGLAMDRDLNAAINIRSAGLARTHACGPEGSDSSRKTKVKPCRVEAGTKPRADSRRLAN